MPSPRPLSGDRGCGFAWRVEGVRLVLVGGWPCAARVPKTSATVPGIMHLVYASLPEGIQSDGHACLASLQWATASTVRAKPSFGGVPFCAQDRTKHRRRHTKTPPPFLLHRATRTRTHSLRTRARAARSLTTTVTRSLVAIQSSRSAQSLISLLSLFLALPSRSFTCNPLSPTLSHSFTTTSPAPSTINNVRPARPPCPPPPRR